MQYERLQPLSFVARTLDVTLPELRQALDRNPKIVAHSLDGFIYLTQSQTEKIKALLDK